MPATFAVLHITPARHMPLQTIHALYCCGVMGLAGFVLLLRLLAFVTYATTLSSSHARTAMPAAFSSRSVFVIGLYCIRPQTAARSSAASAIATIAKIQ